MIQSVESKFLAPVDAELSGRIAWLIQLRWVAVVGALLAITGADILWPGVLPVVPLLGVVAFIGVYNVLFYVYAYTLRHLSDADSQWRKSVRFVYVQMALDLFGLTVLLRFAGGVENPFWALYVLHIIIASILLSRLAAFVYAGLATVLYISLITAEYFGWIAHVHLSGFVHPDQYHQESYLAATAFAFGATLFFAALMATTIVTHLRQRDHELLEANQRNEERAVELVDLNRRLKEADDARKSFILMVTHELRAPIAAIQSYINLILGGYVAPDKQPEILDRANRRATEELERINDLLILSHVQDRQAATTSVDLGEVVGYVIDLLRGAMQEKQITLVTEVDPSAPPLIANRDQIVQLWMNLISNAVKYTPDGGLVSVTLSHTPALVKGSVRDTGIGIDREDRERCFEEFYRSEEAKKMVRHGTGLGLSIVKRILDRLGGGIWVRSAPGQGSTFTFVLPKPGIPGDVFARAHKDEEG